MSCKKNCFLSILSIIFSCTCYAQQKPCIKCFENPLNAPEWQPCCVGDSVSPAVYDLIRKRGQNYDFHYVMRNLQEPSTITSFATWRFHNLGFDKKNLVLEADLQFPISIGGKRFGMNEIQVIPRFQVRIFANDRSWPYGTKGDISLPVRTPSEMPGLAYYHGFRNWWLNDRIPLQFIGLYVYHHSNGQDGDEIDTTHNNKRINLYNGNFSEDVIFEFIAGGKINFRGNDIARTLRSNQRKLHFQAQGKQIFLRMTNEKELFWKLSYEYHPKSLSNTVFDSLRIYGRHRLNIRAGLLFLPKLWELVRDGNKWCSLFSSKKYERWRFTMNMSYIMDKDYYRGDLNNLEKIKPFNLKRRLNILLSSYMVMGRTGFAAAFAQAGYFGSDNYNIYFNDSFWHFKVGLAFTFFDQPSEKDNF